MKFIIIVKIISMKTLNKVEITIPEPFIKDFTIIYKGEEELGEIKTSKDEILRKLRYFKLKYNVTN